MLILSVLLAMFPIFGTHGQYVCIQIHRTAAIACVVVAMMGCVRAQRKP